MKSIKRIVVPVDFTDFSRRAAEYAVMLARQFRAKVVLVHVIEPFTYDINESMWVVDHYAALKAIGERLLDQQRKALTRKGMAVQTSLLRGAPAFEIIDEARRRRADLIVMGTHGRTGLQHLVLGSVAERVVRLAACPVLTVGSGKGLKHRKPLPLI
ncbi:MAG: universal stress protein [Nitrospirae bacterium]|nr:universal stress protein [Nitrospirota bacterium]